MKTFKINCFEAYTNSDTTEGRGVAVHIGYFTSEDDARRAVRGQGVMGTDAYVKPVDEVVKIYEDFEEFARETRETARQRGLNKLTQEEREALGLSDAGR